MSLTQVPGGFRRRRILRPAARWARRAALVAAMAVATAGTAMLAPEAARAVPDLVEVGDLTLSPSSGPVSATPTWSTSTPCPAGFQGSAALYEANANGTINFGEPISPVVASVTSPFSGALLAGADVASVLALSDVPDGGSAEWIVGCSVDADQAGDIQFVQETEVTLSPDGTSYTTSCTGGNMCLVPGSGASSQTPTWETVAGCPAAYLFSAALYTLNADGSLGSQISPVVDDVAGPFGGTLLADVAQDFSGTGVTDGQTDEWVVVCFGPAGPIGQGDRDATVYVTLSADGSAYTTSPTQPPLTATTTTLTVSPQPSVAPTTVALTATVTAADGTNPGGSVEFEIDGTTITDGFAYAVNADGVATATSDLLFAPGEYTLEAVLTPANIFSYASSTGTFTANVAATAGAAAVTVTIPSTGELSVTVAAGTATLTESGATTPLTATGTLNTVTVMDTRNYLPGWSVSGQESVFTGSGAAAGATIPGDELGWIPTGTVTGGATLGPIVASGASPGLADAPQLLASAAPGNGFGTSTLGAILTLDIPDTAFAGPYLGVLTLTYLDVGP